MKSAMQLVLELNSGLKCKVRTAAMAALIACAAPWAAAQSSPQAPAKPVATSAIPAPVLKKRAEEIYTAVRNALIAQDYETFLQLTLPAGKGKPPPKEVFDKIALRLLDDYPVLESLIFVRMEKSGDWIGYYAEDRISDPKKTFIFFFRFKRVGNDLKMSGRVVVKDIAQVSGQFRTLDEIQLNPIFRLPGQKGYKE